VEEEATVSLEKGLKDVNKAGTGDILSSGYPDTDQYKKIRKFMLSIPIHEYM
jgi:hypothetical protein